MNKPGTITLMLRAACFFLFVGRGWQHIVWDAPYRTLFWDESLMKGWIERFAGMSWHEYVTSPALDQGIQAFIKCTGIFYLLCAVLSLVIQKPYRWMACFLLFASANLVFLAFLYCKEKFFHVGQFFEYTIQVVCPILLCYWIFRQLPSRLFVFLIKMVVALTFICHGLYAIGYYPQPGNYLDMIIRCLDVQEALAITLLKSAAILDFLTAILLFIPKTDRFALVYMIVWGILTAFARTTTYFEMDFAWQSINQWLPETLYRLPHGLIPWVLLLLLKQSLIKKG